MRKILAFGILIFIFMTGCTRKGEDITLQEYYIEVVEDFDKELDLKEIKKDLSNFEYEKTEEKIEEENSNEKEVLYISYNVFKDKNNNTIDISWDETNDEIIGITYKNDYKESYKTISCINGFSSLIIVDNQVNNQKVIIDRLNLSEDISIVIEQYFKIVEKLSDNKEMSIDYIKDFIGYEYKKEEIGLYNDIVEGYIFDIKKLGVKLHVTTENKIVREIYIKTSVYPEDNYYLTINSKSDNYLGNTDTSIDIEITIGKSYLSDMFDGKDEKSIKEKTKNNNIGLYNFIYSNEDLESYSYNSR